MGTQIDIARQIKEAQGDYVLALKSNQGKLYTQVKDWFEQAIEKNWNSVEYSYDDTMEGGHHRVESRQVWAVAIAELPALHRQRQWRGLTTVVRVCSTRYLWNKPSFMTIGHRYTFVGVSGIHYFVWIDHDFVVATPKL